MGPFCGAGLGGQPHRQHFGRSEKCKHLTLCHRRQWAEWRGIASLHGIFVRVVDFPGIHYLAFLCTGKSLCYALNMTSAYP